MSLNVRSSISPAPCICGIFLLWCRFRGHFFSFLISPEILGSLNHSPSFGSQSTTAVTCLFRRWVVYPSYMDWRERWVKGVRCTCNWNVNSMQWRFLSKEGTSTKCIMSDKNMTERTALSEQFPQSKLLICLFHTLRTMKREVSCEKLGISHGERSIYAWLKIVYARDEEEYIIVSSLMS